MCITFTTKIPSFVCTANMGNYIEVYPLSTFADIGHETHYQVLLTVAALSDLGFQTTKGNTVLSQQMIFMNIAAPNWHTVAG